MIQLWKAKKIGFNFLVFSLIAFVQPLSFAQNVEEQQDELSSALENDENAPSSPQVGAREATRVNLQSAPQSSLSTQPVVVTTSMAPSQVPQAMPQNNAADQRSMPQGLVVNAPGTGIGGSNPGNANTGGVQVQHVTVQANPSAENVNNAENVADILRRHRIKSEVDNENRLIERLEMGRLEDERVRAQSIDGFQSSVSQGANSQMAGAVTQGDQSPATAVAAGENSTVTIQQVTPVDGAGGAAVAAPVNTLRSSGSTSSTGFGISPFLGRRWYTSGNDYFDVENRFVTGVLMDGSINEFLGLEGNFSYSKDEITDISGIGGNYLQYGNGGYYYGAPIRERQNFEVGISLKVSAEFARIRPFGILGLGARQARYDIDDGYTTALAEQAGWQRSTNKMLGLMGAGLDLRLSQNLSLGGRFDYQAVLNKKADYMDMLYDDSSNSYQGVGTLKLSF